jgi:hypothetical protein
MLAVSRLPGIHSERNSALSRLGRGDRCALEGVPTRRRSAADAAERRESRWESGCYGSKGGVVGEGPAGRRSHVGVPRDFLVGTFRAHPAAAAVRPPPGAAPGTGSDPGGASAATPPWSAGSRRPSSRRFRTGRRRPSHPTSTLDVGRCTGTSRRCGFAAAHIHRWEAGYRLGSDRGSPNHPSTPSSKRVMAQTRSPLRVRTNRPTPWRTPVRGAQVGPERRLTVGPRRHQVNPPARAEDDAGAEARHDLAALVFEGHRRHREADVVGQQGHQRLEVGGLPRADEPRHHRLLGG